MSEEFYSHKIVIRTPPDQLAIDMARQASAYKVLSEALAEGSQSLVMTFPQPKQTDDGLEVLVYGIGDHDD